MDIEKYIEMKSFSSNLPQGWNEVKEILKEFEQLGKTEELSDGNLKEKFTEGFIEQFQYDAEFRSIYYAMINGLSPYKAIEHLCKTKKELFDNLEDTIKNIPRKIILTTEEFEKLTNQNKGI